MSTPPIKDIRHDVLAALQAYGPISILALVEKMRRRSSDVRAALQALVASGHVLMSTGERKWRHTAPEKFYQAAPGAQLEPKDSKTTPKNKADPKGLARILEALDTCHTAEQIANYANVSVRHVRDTLAKLVAEGKVTCQDGPKAPNGGNSPRIYTKVEPTPAPR